MPSQTNCDCINHATEHIDLDENDVVLRHYFSCWKCGSENIIKDNGVCIYYEELEQ